jgi:tetratricopeptide (TPR) repeat protein
MSDSDTSKLLAVARKTPSNLRYFLERLDDPEWIGLLEREGFFASPPDVEQSEDDEGAWLRFPDWPASRYLVRMANATPQHVAQVFLELPATDNIRVHEDIIEAAQQMPAEWADRLASAELGWFDSNTGPLLNYPAKFVGLGLHLLQAKRRERARAMFDAVLELRPAEGARSTGRHMDTRLSDREYGKALKAIWPALLEDEGPQGLRLLTGKLQRAVELSMGEGGDDLSYIWRSAVEDHSQDLGHSVFDELVDATRDMAVAAAATDLHGVLQLLREREGPLFVRLELHVLREVGDQAPEVTAEALLDRENLESPDRWHEYAELLRSRFSQLNREEQERLLVLISSGTAEEAIDLSDDGERRRAYRRFKRLALIAEHLDGEARADYEVLLERYGPADHPEFLAHTSSWSGPTSPLGPDEIRQLAPAELVAFLQEWEPEETFGPHSSPEGLGRVLADVVAETPDPYAREASLLVGSDPTYVRAVLDGLSRAAKEGRSFEWQEPLELAHWVTQQQGVTRPDDIDRDRDTGWRWTRKALAGLLGRGLNEGAATLPEEAREMVWSLLAGLTEDPDPTPRQEADEEGMDPATRSLNVTRGEAMHSLIRYVLWVERIQGDSFTGLASVPEAKAVLERRLDPDTDQSPAIRAVYGMWLAQLVRVDETWFEEHVETILPPDVDQRRLFAAAWDAYILFTRPWLRVFELTERAHALAVERLPEALPDSGLVDRPDEKLGEHLVWYAVMSAIPIDEPGLWQDFWRRASQHLRQHAVEHLGRMFQNASDVPEEVRTRVERLWTWVAANVDEGERAQTLSPFGWLLAANALDDEWLLRQALALLEEGVHLDADFIVWEALTRTVEAHPAASAGVLRMMIQTDPNGWAVSGSEEPVRRILERALESGDPEARRRAKDSINLLGARGMHAFRDLADGLRE